MKSSVQRFLQLLSGEIGADLIKAADPLITSEMDSRSLKQELANKFIDLVVDESTLLKNVRVHRTDSPAGDLTKLNVTTNVTEGATENSDSGNTRRPVNSALSFATKKSRSALDVSGEWVEDNVAGKQGRGTALGAFMKAIANDMEVLSIEGDDGETGSTDWARLIKIDDGYHVLTAAGTGTHILDAEATRPSHLMLSDALKAMPTKWKRNLTDLRWIMSWDAAQCLVDEYADRPTIYGDEMRRKGTLPPYYGIPVLIVPFIPNDLTLSGTSGTTGTFIWLTNPKNFVYVVQRNITAEWDRNARYDRDELTVYMRTDRIVENTDAVVKINNVSVWNEHDFYGASE